MRSGGMPWTFSSHPHSTPGPQSTWSSSPVLLVPLNRGRARPAQDRGRQLSPTQQKGLPQRPSSWLYTAQRPSHW
jgi:hypothetical protein